MFAVFVDGSRQYRVSEGDLVKVDFREAETGTNLEFARVFLYRNGDELPIGPPHQNQRRPLPRRRHRPRLDSKSRAALRHCQAASGCFEQGGSIMRNRLILIGLILAATVVGLSTRSAVKGQPPANPPPPVTIT